MKVWVHSQAVRRIGQEDLHPHLSNITTLLQDYELEAEKLRSILDLENGRNGYMNKRPRLQSPAAKVKEEVKQ